MTAVIMGALIAVALILAAVGLLLTSNATIGVGLIGLACFAGILARIAQASYHHTIDRKK